MIDSKSALLKFYQDQLTLAERDLHEAEYEDGDNIDSAYYGEHQVALGEAYGRLALLENLRKFMLDNYEINI